MKQRIVLGVLGAGLCSLMGCSGGGDSVSNGPGTTPPAPTYAIYTLQAAGTNPPTAVLEFNSSQSGSVTPAATINMATGVYAYGLATDSTGNLYIATNNSTNSAPAVLVYTTSGAAGPTLIRTLSGTATTLTYPQSLALDSTNQLYVLNGDGTIDVFAASANGNVAPKRSFTATDYGTGFAADSAGNVYVSGFTGSVIYVYAASATGAATPVHTISGAATQLGHIFNLAVDSTGALWAGSTLGTPTGTSNVGGQILIFPSGADGNIAPEHTLSGSSTGFVNLNAFAFDSVGHVYESDSANFSDLSGPTINIFASGATGNVAPTSHITSTAWTNAYEGSSMAAF